MDEAQSKRDDVKVAKEDADAAVFKQVVPGPAEDGACVDPGKIIPGKETPVKAVHRRTREDTGLTMPDVLKPFSCYGGESDSTSELLCPCFPELVASTDATPDPEESPGAEDNPGGSGNED